jgi:hypothetical protein
MSLLQSSSLDTRRESGLFDAEENCAQMGASSGPLAEEGGVVFSLSRGCAWAVYAARSLLERFIFPNMADKLVLDLLFLMLMFSVLAGDPDLRSSFFSLFLEGDEGGDCTFDCRSPSTFALEWSAGSSGTDLVLAFACDAPVRVGDISGDTGLDLDETSDLSMPDRDDLFRWCCGRSGSVALAEDVAMMNAADAVAVYNCSNV